MKPRHTLTRVVVGLVLLGTALGGCDFLFEPTACEAVCALEAECSFRSEEQCLRQRCDREGEFQNTEVNANADACSLAAETCLDLVVCTCEPSCEVLTECGISDVDGEDECTNTCVGLTDSVPIVTYEENRCRLESSCATLARCGGA
jgi:hypothetical protein